MSEGYDITIHLGSQIENFLNSYDQADVETMVRVTDNFKDICKNAGLPQLVKQLDEWETYRKGEISKTWKKARQSLETLLTAKNGEELFIDMEEIKNDVVTGLNKLEKEYWDSIRGLMLRSVKNEG